jgi:hypothetical protein
MENSGWIKLFRIIMDHPDWLSEPFTRAQAWVDILLLANHKVGFIRKRGILIEVQRGQLGHSEETLAARWKWSREKVRRFLGQLKADGQISRNPVQQNPKLSCLISVVNYEAYQSNETTNETTEKHQTVQEQECKKKKKEYSPSFLTFWSAYPRKVGKDEAYRTWQKRNGDMPSIDGILASISKQKTSAQWQKDGGQFIPHPATWLNQGRWNDEIPEEMKKSSW